MNRDAEESQALREVETLNAMMLNIFDSAKDADGMYDLSDKELRFIQKSERRVSELHGWFSLRRIVEAW
jgi:hypothetical protein